MDFEAEAKKLHGDELLHKLRNDPDMDNETITSVIVSTFADALRRAYEAGAADALIKKIDAIAGGDWSPVNQGAPQ